MPQYKPDPVATWTPLQMYAVMCYIRDHPEKFSPPLNIPVCLHIHDPFRTDSLFNWWIGEMAGGHNLIPGRIMKITDWDVQKYGEKPEVHEAT